MKILLDHCTPAPLKRYLPTHQVMRAGQMGWSALQNGQLLQMAESSGFDLLITCDQNMTYQQNLRDRKIGILILGIQQWPELEPFANAVTAMVDQITAGEYRWMF
jgi:hypothetical protein